MRQLLLRLAALLAVVLLAASCSTSSGTTLDQVKDTKILRVGTRQGTVLPARSASGGKALLAELNREKLESLYRGPTAALGDEVMPADEFTRFAADLVLIPLNPSPPDLWAAEGTLRLAAAEKRHGEPTEGDADKVKAMAAATDNVGLFFGEDIFFAIGSIVLIQATLATYGYDLAPLELALWAIPSAIGAFLIHGFRLWRFERSLRRDSQ